MVKMRVKVRVSDMVEDRVKNCVYYNCIRNMKK